MKGIRGQNTEVQPKVNDKGKQSRYRASRFERPEMYTNGCGRHSHWEQCRKFVHEDNGTRIP